MSMTVIRSVDPGSPAQRAGVQVGDYLLFADGQELRTSTDLLRVRRQHYLGETMELVVWRNGERLQVTLELDQSAED